RPARRAGRCARPRWAACGWWVRPWSEYRGLARVEKKTAGSPRPSLLRWSAGSELVTQGHQHRPPLRRVVELIRIQFGRVIFAVLEVLRARNIVDVFAGHRIHAGTVCQEAG